MKKQFAETRNKLLNSFLDLRTDRQLFDDYFEKL